MNNTLPKSFFKEYEQFDWTNADSQAVSLALIELRKPRTDTVRLLQDKKSEVEKNIRELEQSLRHFQINALKPIAGLVAESYQAAIAPLAKLSLALEHGLDAALPLPTYEILKLRYDSGNIQWVCHIQDMPIPTDSRIEHTIEIHQIDYRSKKHKQGLDLVLTLVCWWLNTHGQLDVKANEKNPSNGFCEFINWLLHDGLAEPNSIQKMVYRLGIKSDSVKDN